MSSIIDRLKRTLLKTGTMNSLFVEQIIDGSVDSVYVGEALDNFKAAQNPQPKFRHRYVVGFIFNEAFDRILLVFKNRPAWQSGLLNGVGGKIEARDKTPLAAMEREFAEETFARTKIDWRYVGRRFRMPVTPEQDASYEMFVYAATHPDIRALVYDARNNCPAYPVSYFQQNGTVPTFPKIAWKVPKVIPTNHEHTIALPMNREILARRGVPGLAWIVDASVQSLRENFTFEVEDPMRFDDET
jgi:8-oxo-dGTP pyrophosphatase MutT (NUDIX family)